MSNRGIGRLSIDPISLVRTSNRLVGQPSGKNCWWKNKAKSASSSRLWCFPFGRRVNPPVKPAGKPSLNAGGTVRQSTCYRANHLIWHEVDSSATHVYDRGKTISKPVLSLSLSFNFYKGPENKLGFTLSLRLLWPVRLHADVLPGFSNSAPAELSHAIRPTANSNGEDVAMT